MNRKMKKKLKDIFRRFPELYVPVYIPGAIVDKKFAKEIRRIFGDTKK